MFFVQINHTGKGFLFLIFREIKLRKYSSLHKLFYGLTKINNYIVNGFKYEKINNDGDYEYVENIIRLCNGFRNQRP